MGSQRHCIRKKKKSIFLHIFLLILVQVSPQEIEHTKSFVLSSHQMILRTDVCFHGKPILRSLQLELQIVARITELSKGLKECK